MFLFGGMTEAGRGMGTNYILKTLCLPGCNARAFVIFGSMSELSAMAAQVGSEALDLNSRSEVDISVLSAEEHAVPRINNYGSVVS